MADPSLVICDGHDAEMDLHVVLGERHNKCITQT
jgi:hypothetical protein